MNISISKFRYLCYCTAALLLSLGATNSIASHRTGGGGSINASLSTNTVDISVGENGSWRISGNDGGSSREFRWSLPSGLSVSAGSSSGMDRFRVRADRGYFQAQTAGNGSFSGTVNVSSNSASSYTMSSTRAEISLSPRDVTVNVADSGGGGSGGGGTGGGGSGGGSGTADYTFYIERGVVDIFASPVTGNGATTIPAWGYTTAAGGLLVPGPVIETNEGDTVTVEVVNNHNINHNFVVEGISSDSTAIPPGGSRIYTLNTSRAGVYMYHDTLNNGINQALGLFGAVVVGPSDGSNRAWTNGPRYNDKRTWVVTDMDKPNWNQRADNGNSVNTSNYKPNYFLMNGKNGFHAMEDMANVNIVGGVGDVFLVRMVNAGQYDQSLHFHGNHYQLISRSGNRISPSEWQDTINLKAGETAMVLYQIRHLGLVPMHVHTAQMETGNGVYLNGTAAMIVGQ